MGQYHLVVNLTKKEFLHPHKLGVGFKLLEQLCMPVGTCQALLILTACSNGGAGGDLEPDPMIGRWAGDRIAVIGDYAKSDDLSDFDARSVYDACCGESDEEYTDISGMVRPVLAQVGKVGDPWG